MLSKVTLFFCSVFVFSGTALTASSPIVTTIAGGVNGKTGWEAGGFSGDGGPATESALDDPGGLSIDSEGNLFIADQQNHRIRKIDTDGNISTIAGIGMHLLEEFAAPIHGRHEGLPGSWKFVHQKCDRGRLDCRRCRY